MVLNGKEGPRYKETQSNRSPAAGYPLLGSRPAFSPDGRHLAYLAWRGDKRCVVVDGVEGQAYDGIPLYSKCVFVDSHSLHTIAYRGGEFFRVEVQIAEKQRMPQNATA